MHVNARLSSIRILILMILFHRILFPDLPLDQQMIFSENYKTEEEAEDDDTTNM
jgi:hypothetical protein